MENKTFGTGPAGLSQIIEALQQHAQTCETASEDATEESLTGEASLREKNVEDARVWMIKSRVWLEAVAVVRGLVESGGQPGARSRPPAK